LSGNAADKISEYWARPDHPPVVLATPDKALTEIDWNPVRNLMDS
jgi:hypothetical protein